MMIALGGQYQQSLLKNLIITLQQRTREAHRYNVSIELTQKSDYNGAEVEIAFDDEGINRAYSKI